MTRHYPDLGSDASSLWNFCTHFSDAILRGNGWLPHLLLHPTRLLSNLMRALHITTCKEISLKVSIDIAAYGVKEALIIKGCNY